MLLLVGTCQVGCWNVSVAAAPEPASLYAVVPTPSMFWWLATLNTLAKNCRLYRSCNRKSFSNRKSSTILRGYLYVSTPSAGTIARPPDPSQPVVTAVPEEPLVPALYGRPFCIWNESSMLQPLLR